jgi:hypothetical protein
MAIVNGVETQAQRLSYDKIIKNTLAQSDELTIRFVNGLFGDDVPLGATVEWLDKESVNDKHAGFIADFYPRIDGSMYHIEVEQDDNGDMAVRVFKYTVGGAILHNMMATDSQLDITFPKPCVVFLKSGEDTPKTLTWNIKFFDGQAVTLRIPTIRLAELSVKEIAERNLFPIGQFYLRTFEPLTEPKAESFLEAAAALLKELKGSVDAGRVPHHIGLQMQDTIRAVIENTVARSRMEVGFDMNTNIVETLPWIDYREVFQKIEERGEERGKVTRDTEIALNAFRRAQPGSTGIIETLKDFGISDDTIRNAHRRVETERAGGLHSAEADLQG